jgi:uncharacterized membrane protein (Fun14 family)
MNKIFWGLIAKGVVSVNLHDILIFTNSLITKYINQSKTLVAALPISIIRVRACLVVKFEPKF